MLRRIQDKSTRRNSLFPFGQTLFRLRFKSHRTLTIVLSIILTVCHVLYILAQKVIAHRCQTFNIEKLVRRMNDCFQNGIFDGSSLCIIQGKGHHSLKTIWLALSTQLAADWC